MTAALAVSVCLVAALPGHGDYIAAREAERRQDYAAAITVYAKCIEHGTSLTPYAHLRIAHCHALANEFDKATARYRYILDELPEGPWTTMAQAYYASFLATQEKAAEAAPLFKTLVALQPQPWWFARYRWLAAANQLALPEDQEQGYDYFANLVEETLFRSTRLRAARQLAQSPEPNHQYMAARGMCRAGAFTETRKLLIDLVSGACTGNPPAPNATSLDAWTLHGTSERPPWQKNLAASMDIDGIKRLWLAALAGHALQTDDPKQAHTACRVLATHHADSREAGEALWALARYYEREDKPRLAAEQYVRLAALCAQHRRADNALLAAGKLFMRLKEDTQALDTFTRLRDGHPESAHLPAACYLRAYLHGKSGKRGAQQRDYAAACLAGVGQYYAHRAHHYLQAKTAKDTPSFASNLKVDGTHSFVRPFSLAAPPTPRINLGDDVRFRRLTFFGQRGMEEGEWEALGIARALADTPATAADAYLAMAEAGFACSAKEMARSAQWGIEDGQPSVARQRLKYPRAYWKEVCALGKETRVDPYLILAVARQESTFRPALSSSAGAQGVMQVMPATAKWLARIEPALTIIQAQRLDLPANSLRVGTYYLSRMIRQFDGNIVYALAAYNAGPGNVRKWRKRSPHGDLDDFIETLPYRETSHYVKAVLGNYAAYHSLYPPP